MAAGRTYQYFLFRPRVPYNVIIRYPDPRPSHAVSGPALDRPGRSPDASRGTRVASGAMDQGPSTGGASRSLNWHDPTCHGRLRRMYDAVPDGMMGPAIHRTRSIRPSGACRCLMRHPVPSSAGPLRSQTRAKSHFSHFFFSGVASRSPALMPDTALDISSSTPSASALRLHPVDK